MNAPARDPGDLGVAHGAEPALKLPEKAKSPRTPKRFRHMISFAFFEVGFRKEKHDVSHALSPGHLQLNRKPENLCARRSIRYEDMHSPWLRCKFNGQLCQAALRGQFDFFDREPIKELVGLWIDNWVSKFLVIRQHCVSTGTESLEAILAGLARFHDGYRAPVTQT